MPRSSFQKLKIIYIMEYLLKNSDEDHTVTTNQIIAYLKSHDITDAIETTSTFGISADRAVTYHSDRKGTELNYNVLNNAVSTFRFSLALDDDWKAPIEADRDY